MRRFLLVSPGRPTRIVGRGVAFTDEIIGVRWGDEPRMTLVWMDERTFANAMRAGGEARVRWIDRKVCYQ